MYHIEKKLFVSQRGGFISCDKIKYQLCEISISLLKKQLYFRISVGFRRCIVGNFSLDVDYTKVLYITDTGRAWNKTGASVRDKVEGGLELKVKNTRRLITLIGNDELPEKLIINTHPQRWFDFGWGWMNEFICQHIKNAVKKALVAFMH